MPANERTPRKPLPRWAVVLLVVLGTVSVDWVSKRWAEENLQQTAPQSYLGDTFRIQYAENAGAFLGMGNQWSPATRFWVFTAATSVFLAFVAWTTLRHPDIDRLELIAVALILGGGIGNLIDRVTREGVVVDFMNMGVGSLRTGIFNVADVALTAGVLIWCFRPRRKEATAADGAAPTA